MLEMARDFLGSEKSYRKAVQHQQKWLVYDDRQENPMAHQGASLAHSTLWHWQSWLGRLTKTLQSATQLISQTSPGHGLHWEMIPIDPEKRSQRGTTQDARTGGTVTVGRGRVRAANEKADLPPVCNGLWLAVS